MCWATWEAILRYVISAGREINMDVVRDVEQVAPEEGELMGTIAQELLQQGLQQGEQRGSRQGLLSGIRLALKLKFGLEGQPSCRKFPKSRMLLCCK